MREGRCDSRRLAERIATRLYGWTLLLFPRAFRNSEREDVLGTFRTMWREAGHPGRQIGLLVRCLVRVPQAAWGSWRDEIGRSGRGPTGADRASPGPWRGGGRMRGWFGYAVRSVTRSPGFTATAAVMVGLGVAAVTSVFTVIDHVLLRPLPYPETERLVYVTNGSHSLPLFRDFQDVSSVEMWAASRPSTVILSAGAQPRRTRQAVVSRDFFRLFGGVARMGRLPAAVEPGVAVVSHGSWRRIWGSDPDLVGRTVRLDGEPVTVVGVLEEGFVAPEALVGRNVDFWRPIDPAVEEFGNREYHLLRVAGRLGPGSTLEGLNAEMEAVSRRAAEIAPDVYVQDDGSARTWPVVPLREATVQGAGEGLGLMLGAVGLLLLVACANVAHLFLARGLGRGGEMAVRRSLGAPTGTLVAQLLAESALVGLLGGALGIALAIVAVDAFLALGPGGLPRISEIAVDARIVAVAVGVSVGTAVIFGLLPAVQALRRDVNAELRPGSRTATGSRTAVGLRGALVAGEIALSVVIVATAGLLVRSFAELRGVEPGIRIDDVVTVPLTPGQIETPADWVALADRLEASVASVAGVLSATYGLTVPLEETGGSTCCWRATATDPDGGGNGVPTMIHPVSEGFFETFGIPLEAGRAWARPDRPMKPVPVVVNRVLADRLYGSATRAVGRSIELPGDRYLTVVGVVPDTRHFGLDREHGAALYAPPTILGFAIDLLHVAVRTRPSGVDPAALRSAVWSVDPGLAVPTVRTMREWSAASTADARFESLLYTAFGLLTLVLAAGGLYGTIAYTVGQRRREMGIRLALGASARRLTWRVVGGGLRLAVLGIAVGLVGTVFATPLMENRLFGIGGRDPWALSVTIAVLLATTLLASWVPARRAGRTDPVKTLAVE